MHWKHNATRCAVVGCDRTRVKGWSTCALVAHYSLGRSLYGAGRIEPISASALLDADHEALPIDGEEGNCERCPFAVDDDHHATGFDVATVERWIRDRTEGLPS